MKRQKKEAKAKTSKKFDDEKLVPKARPAVHIKPKQKKVAQALKYGIFTCSRCGGPKSGKSPGTLCYACKHPERKVRPVGKRRKRRGKKDNRKTRRLASTGKRHRGLLVLRSIATDPTGQPFLDEIMADMLLREGDTNEA